MGQIGSGLGPRPLAAQQKLGQQVNKKDRQKGCSTRKGQDSSYQNEKRREVFLLGRKGSNSFLGNRAKEDENHHRGQSPKQNIRTGKTKAERNNFFEQRDHGLGFISKGDGFKEKELSRF